MNRELDSPRINSQSGNCALGVVESMSRFQFAIENLNKVFSGHSFYYRRPGRTIRLNEEGEVNAELSSGGLAGGQTLEAQLSRYYGISLDRLIAQNLKEAISIVSDHIGRGIPLACDFDFKFMRGRKEYGKRSVPHAVLVSGVKETESSIVGRSQYIDRLAILKEDLEAAIANFLARGQGLKFYALRSNGKPAELTSLQVTETASANLKNLESADPGEGLVAMANYLADINVFLGIHHPARFFLPGIWVFGQERFAVASWIKEVERDLGLSGNGSLESFSTAFRELGNKWTMVGWMFEHGQSLNNSSVYYRAFEMLQELLHLERASLPSWKVLRSLGTVPA